MAITPAGGGVGSATSSGPEGAGYSPLRKPTTGLDITLSDEFTGGENGSWAWVNQGAATVTNELDTSVITGTTATELQMRARYQAAPVNMNFVLSTQLTPKLNDIGAANGAAVGIAVVDAGTALAPTSLKVMAVNWQSGNSMGAYVGTKTSLTSAVGGLTSFVIKYAELSMPMFVQMRYVDSTRACQFVYSYDGISWVNIGAAFTLTNDPIALYRYVDNNNNVTAIAVSPRWHWWRVRTDTTGNTAPFPCGS